MLEPHLLMKDVLHTMKSYAVWYNTCSHLLKSVTETYPIFDGEQQPPWGGGGGKRNPLYKLYRYVPPHRVGFLRRFGLKTDISCAHFGLKSGMVFGRTTRVYEGIYRFNSK